MPSPSEEWVRSVRGIPAKPGIWHLVLPRSRRSWSHSLLAECGVYPSYYKQRADARPTEGKVCPKCIKAAEARVLPPATTEGPA